MGRKLQNRPTGRHSHPQRSRLSWHVHFCSFQLALRVLRVCLWCFFHVRMWTSISLPPSGGKRGRRDRPLGAGHLRRGTTAAGSTRAATAAAVLTAREAAAATALAAGTAFIAATTAASHSSPVVAIVGSAVCAGLGATCLHHNVLAVDGMRVGSDSSQVTSRRGKLNKGAVL